MNLNLKNIFIASLLLGLCACSDEKDSPVNGQEREVRVFGSVMSNSRVSFEQDGNVTHALWDDGDRIGLYGGGQGNLEYVVSKDGTGMVEFKPENEVLKCVDGTSVVAYYPYSEKVEEMIVPLPKTSSYVWSDMKPFVYADNVVENSRVSLRFKHPFAYLKVTFGKKDLPEWATSQTLDAVEVTAEGKKLGIEEGYFNLRNLQQMMTSATSTITVDAANFDLSVSDFCCYIPVLPQEALQPLSFKFIQKNGNVSDELFACQKKASEGGLEAGYVYEVALNDEELSMSPEQVKSRLDAIGREFVGNFDAAEFKEIKNTARYIKDVFCMEDDATDAVSTWYDACLEAITEKTGGRDEVNSWKNEYYSWTYEYFDYYHYADLTRMYAASQFVGHFTVKDKIWVKEEGEFTDMQFTAPDEDGTLCTLKLTTDGDTKKIYVGDSEEWDWYNWTSEERDSLVYEIYTWTDRETGVEIIDTIGTSVHKIYKYTEECDVNSYQNYVFIPEKITLEYTRGNEQILKTVITTNHSALKSDRFDIATEGFGITVNTYVNGYEFEMSKMAYDAGKNAEVACKLNKNGVNLITVSAYSDLTLTGDLYEEDVEFENWQNATLSLDLIHQAQLKFTCTDALKVDEHMDMAEANETDEAIFKKELQEINKLMNGGLYFDGKATQQAWVTVEAFEDEDWGEGYWRWEPVLNFSDGSNYSAFSTFFDEDEFMGLINVAWDLMDDFVNLAKQFHRD